MDVPSLSIPWVRMDVPSLYVGESSHSVYERGGEHWQDWKAKKPSSHMLKHQEEVHDGDDEPKFTLRIVKSYRSALARQVGEAVRIRRRGGEAKHGKIKPFCNKSLFL